MQVRDHPSPNHNDRQSPVSMVVIHYTSQPRDQALATLCDPARPAAQGGRVSAHYLIDTDGTVYRLVPEDRRAWHAGVSSWRGITDVNSAAIGIELVNDGRSPYAAAQLAALKELLADIRTRHGIPQQNIVGHSDIAPGRKQDPGPWFPWRALAAAGFGLWPSVDAPPKPVDIPQLQQLLAALGYACPQSGALDRGTAAALLAFQAHYRPEDIRGEPDAETMGLLVNLVEQASREAQSRPRAASCACQPRQPEA